MKKSKLNETQLIFQHFLKQNNVYNPGQIVSLIQTIKPFAEYSGKKGVVYYNIPCSFDIETTSFYDNGNKRAIMYEWSMCLLGLCVIGRTWDDFVSVINTISRLFGLNRKFRMIIYVHNLSFEFQFFRKWLNIKKVFALENRKPVYVVCDNGIEFRCSYLLSGYSLETVGKNLQTYDIMKKTGDLDYTLPRHSKTPMTEKEKGYCINDVKVVCAYIQELIDRYGGIGKLPITKTGFVRSFCRNECLNSSGGGYSSMIRGLTIEPDEYLQLKRAFMGGFTHCNPFYSGKVVNNVTSYDFTSSYPFVMIAEQFPMSSGRKIEIASDDDLQRYLKNYCCLFDLEIFGLEPKLYYENYLSRSRCWDVVKPVVNNGRIVSAEHLKTTVTEQDFIIIRKFYSWESIRIANFRIYEKDYLPTKFVFSVLSLYRDKTTLKGVEGKEQEYMGSKEMLNSCY